MVLVIKGFSRSDTAAERVDLDLVDRRGGAVEGEGLEQGGEQRKRWCVAVMVSQDLSAGFSATLTAFRRPIYGTPRRGEG